MYQINNTEIYDRICTMYAEVLAMATDKGYTTDFEIHVSPILAKELELKDKLTVPVGSAIIDVPIVVDEAIKEVEAGDNRYRSDIYIFDPEWLDNDS